MDTGNATLRIPRTAGPAPIKPDDALCASGRPAVAIHRHLQVPLLIRELRATDDERLIQIHERLGARSRVQRYLSPKLRLSERDIVFLTDIDGWKHVGLIAFTAAPVSPIAVARYVRNTEQLDLAEVAVEVIDRWQRHGVGRLLVTELRARAVDAGVRRVAWTALASNRAVTSLSRGLSNRRCTPVGDGVVQWSAEL